jgi:hypothetical protein
MDLALLIKTIYSPNIALSSFFKILGSTHLIHCNFNFTGKADTPIPGIYLPMNLKKICSLMIGLGISCKSIPFIKTLAILVTIF